MDERDRPAPDPAVDELTAIGALLAVPLPSAETVEAARARLARVSQGGPAAPRRPGRPARRLRGGPRWLAPVAAAVAVAVVVSASVAIARTVASGPGSGHARPPAAGLGPRAIAQVPTFFVSLTSNNDTNPAVVSATATGQVVGIVPVPRPAHQFWMVASAGNGRDFVLAATGRLPASLPSGMGPARFYRLVLSPSGRPGRLTRLPVPVQTRQISGLALSADGRQLAVSFLPPGNRKTGAMIKVFSLATGAERHWMWPGPGHLGSGAITPDEYAARTISWTADGRRLLFPVVNGYGRDQRTQVRLLDTTAPGGRLPAASTRVPISPAALNGLGYRPPARIDGPLLITGDGTMVVGAAHRMLAPVAAIMRVSIEEFSVRTGKLVRVMYEQKISRDSGIGLLWVNRDGTAMIISHPKPKPVSLLEDSLIGVQTGAGFTAFPAPIQHLGVLQPDW